MALRFTTPFGVDWDDLTLDTLRTALDEPMDESLRWEAKGGTIRTEHVREAVCAFANSDLGGIVVLGVTQDRATRAWTFDGWLAPGGEPELWIGQCLDNGGIDPRP